MMPTFVINQFRYGSLVNTKLFSYCMLFISHIIKCSDSQYVGFSQSRHSMIYSLIINISVFCNTVNIIILRSAYKQMIRITALRIITTMANFKQSWLLMIIKKPCDTIILVFYPIKIKSSISPSFEWFVPIPTFVRSGNNYTFPKSSYIIFRHIRNIIRRYHVDSPICNNYAITKEVISSAI